MAAYVEATCIDFIAPPAASILKSPPSLFLVAQVRNFVIILALDFSWQPQALGHRLDGS